MIVYQCYNTINSKTYIGQTKRTLEIRKKEHIKSSKTTKQYFYSALQKYGIENFKWQILCECSSREEMNKMETYYINLLQTNNPDFGYNMTNGGDFNEMNDMARQKLSRSCKGRIITEEARKKMSLAKLGKTIYEETRRKMSLAKRGRKHTEASKKKMSLSCIGRKHTEETKKKLSELKIGCVPWISGRKHTEASKKKMSLSRKKYLTNLSPAGEY